MSAAAADAPPRPGVLTQLRIDTVYCLTGLPLAVAGLLTVLALVLPGFGLTVILIGLPVLTLGLYVARGYADVHRRRLSRVIRSGVTRPRYKAELLRTLRDHDSEHRPGLRRRLLATPSDSQSWLDLLHAVLGFIPAAVAFVLTVTWWAVGVGYTLDFTWGWATYPHDVGVSDLIGLPHGYGYYVAVNMIIGMLFLASAPFVVRGAAMLPAGFSRLLLTRDRVTALQQRVEELTAGRQAAQAAEASALRRLERDIHDGPQQRLVRLTMDLSLAQRRMRTDPDAAAPLLAEAIEQTRETLDELRALSRGIAPPILADRGLEAALAAVTGRCTVQTELAVDLPDGRLPESTENTAYFLVAEALTNVAKHSKATWCQVRVSGDGNLVYVTISDNGMGGAHPSKGHGLAGLADRVRAADGRLDVTSPAGGPTVLTAELPCG
jgi:signal transduction histidine kinase